MTPITFLQLLVASAFACRINNRMQAVQCLVHAISQAWPELEAAVEAAEQGLAQREWVPAFPLAAAAAASSEAAAGTGSAAGAGARQQRQGGHQQGAQQQEGQQIPLARALAAALAEHCPDISVADMQASQGGRRQEASASLQGSGVLHAQSPMQKPPCAEATLRRGHRVAVVCRGPSPRATACWVVDVWAGRWLPHAALPCPCSTSRAVQRHPWLGLRLPAHRARPPACLPVC